MLLPKLNSQFVHDLWNISIATNVLAASEMVEAQQMPTGYPAISIALVSVFIHLYKTKYHAILSLFLLIQSINARGRVVVPIYQCAHHSHGHCYRKIWLPVYTEQTSARYV